MPKVSVIMSVYKEKIEWLRESIESILDQTFKDFEFIIICDNPQYIEGIHVLRDYEKNDSRVRLIFNETNIGLTKSLNKGLAVAKGEYIARMDADDVSMPDRFQQQINFMETHPNVIVLGTNIKYIGDYSYFDSNKWIKINNDDVKAQLLINSCFAHPSVMIRKSVLVENNIKYDEDYRQAQDYRMWEILKDFGDFANLPEPLLQYRVSAAQVSRKHNSKSNDNAKNIRRRLISQVLNKCGISDKDYFHADVIKARNLISKKTGIIDDHSSWCLKKSLYFSTKRKKLFVFVCSIINGDFFRMDFYEKVKYLKIIINYSEAVSL